jgi:hypothetical protein
MPPGARTEARGAFLALGARIDGVYRTKARQPVPYQVKFRSGRAYLTFTELARFIGVTDRATERVIFTNSNELG